MEKSHQETARQIATLIREKQNILIVTHAKMDCDALSSAISLYLILKKLGKKVTAICQDPVPDAFKFLPDTEVMNTEFSGNSNFIITIDASKLQAEGITWEVKGDKVNIILSPTDEKILSQKDFSFSGGEGKNFDLLISCDVADIDQLGKIYEDNVEMFHSLPFIVIDHHASNEGFGTINHIDITNSSTTETLYDLIPVVTGKGHEFIDSDIATLLLAGIITDTGSFQHPNTTPKSFEVAAELIDKGARQQEIIRHLFKTKKLTTLRLWGRVLSKIKYDPIHRFIWSSVNEQDLSDEKATSDEVEGLIDELMSNAPGVEVVLLLKQREDGVVSGSLRTTTPACDATVIAGIFGGGGHRQAAGFKIHDAQSFEEVIARVIPKIQEFQAKRIGLPLEKKQFSLENKEKTKKPVSQIPSDHSLEVKFPETTSLEKTSNFGEEKKELEILEDFETKKEITIASKKTKTIEKKDDFEKVQLSEQKIPKVFPQQGVSEETLAEVEERKRGGQKEEELPAWLSEKREIPEETSPIISEEAEKELPDWLTEQKIQKEEIRTFPEEVEISPKEKPIFTSPTVFEVSPKPLQSVSREIPKSPASPLKKEVSQIQSEVKIDNSQKQKKKENGKPVGSPPQTSQKKASPVPQNGQKPAPKTIPLASQKTSITPIPQKDEQKTEKPAEIMVKPQQIKPVQMVPIFEKKDVPKEEKKPPQKVEQKGSPLGNILDPNPPPDLIPQAPKRPATSPPPPSQYPPQMPQYQTGYYPPGAPYGAPGQQAPQFGGYPPPGAPQFSPSGYGPQMGGQQLGQQSYGGGYSPPPPPPGQGQQYGQSGQQQQSGQFFGGGYMPPPPPQGQGQQFGGYQPPPPPQGQQYPPAGYPPQYPPAPPGGYPPQR
ncbi:DHH family phosphoesterase [Candidatus Peregrinibacteria bacterium]|nr:DHH family phosphoesterase [Candidatus Peregrinibacteria bacterium]